MPQGNTQEETEEEDGSDDDDDDNELAMAVQPSRGGERRPFHGNKHKCIAGHCAKSN